MNNENSQMNPNGIQRIDGDHREEFIAKSASGMGALCVIMIGLFLSIILFVVGLIVATNVGSTV